MLIVLTQSVLVTCLSSASYALCSKSVETHTIWYEFKYIVYLKINMKVILTSKNDVKRMAVEAFLEKYKIPYDELVCVEVDNPLL